MVSRSVTTIALYCPKCGKIEMHDVSRFALRDGAPAELICSCGQRLAEVVETRHRQYLLNIPCVLCGTCHRICLDSGYFWGSEAGKLYCIQDNLELGFIGPREKIAALLEDFRRELVQFLSGRGGEEAPEAIRILFAALNLVHDIAEQGGLVCGCGHSAVEARVMSGCIELYCTHCGGHCPVPANSEEDILRLKSLGRIELQPGYYSHRK